MSVRTTDHAWGRQGGSRALHTWRKGEDGSAALHTDPRGHGCRSMQCNSGACLSSAAARFHVRPVMTDEPLLGAGCWVTHTTQTS